jgi:hypothetical protein
MVNLHQLKNNIKMNENKRTERLMIGNVPELQEVARREVVVGEVGTAAPEFLVVVPFAYMLQCNELVLKILLSAR